MKKLFSLLTLALLTMSAWAQTTVTFDYNEDTGDWTAAGEFTVTKDGVTLSFSNGTINAAYRVYAGSTLTISSTVGNITEIAFTCTSGNPASNFYALDGFNTSTGVWNGNAESVTFTANKQVRATQIDVTIGGEVVETVAAPTLPAAQNFDDSFVVEITDIAEGATAMYSTDGLAWQTYTAPFTITETTTVYAKAVKGEIESEVVSAKYTKNTPVTGTCIVFNYEDDEPITTAQEYTVSRVGASFTVSNGMINGHYRIYKSQTIAFTSTAGNIIRIEFDCTANGTAQYGPGCFTVNDNNGDYSYEGNKGTWTGSATNVTFTASSNQVRCTEIRVYVDGELPSDFVAAPSIPASQNFDESITVEITNNAEGATVMYNTDGETWTAYTEPLTFTETTTLQAKAVKGENESSVVSATYTKNEPAEDITTLAQVNALDDNTEFEFKGDAVVTAQEGQYLWLRDATGYGLIYGTIDGEFTNGQVLSQNWTAKKTTFRGLTEYTNAANLSASGVTNTALAAAQEITALSEDMINAYVLVKNVTSFTVSGKNVTANFEDGTTMVMYNQFNVEVPTTEGNYTVEGAVGKYNENLQLYILSIEGYVPEEHNVNSIAEAYALPENATFTMFDEMVVTYQKGNRLWIRDTEGTSGMIYGDLDATFENGQVLTDGWSATYAIYNNVPEFTNPVDVEADGDNTRDAAPYERETITNANVNEYVILKGLTLLPDADNAKRFYNAADSLVIFNSFNVEIPEVQEGKTYDVIGIATIYYGNPQLYIVEMTENTVAGMRGDVNMDQAVNIADVTTLIDYLLTQNAEGIDLNNANTNQDEAVNIADVTTLVDYLLTNNWND
jgi:hypothetical protein